jgi:hypothetical protein
MPMRQKQWISRSAVLFFIEFDVAKAMVKVLLLKKEWIQKKGF